MMLDETEMLRFDLYGYIQRLGIPEVVEALEDVLKMVKEPSAIVPVEAVRGIEDHPQE